MDLQAHNIYVARGEQQTALNYFQKALPLSHKLGNKDTEAHTLQGLAKIYSQLGEKQKTIDYYQQALSLIKQLDDPSQTAMLLMSIGTFYNQIGEREVVNF